MVRRKHGARYSSKIDMIMGILANGIYRPWFWANYKDSDKQRLLRYEWEHAVSRFERWEIREGLQRWTDRFGVVRPPLPEDFADFIRPKPSVRSREFLSDIKHRLSGG